MTGAFYLYVDSSAIAADSMSLALDLLEKTGVAVTPGCDFGSHAATRHLRIAYTTSQQRLAEAVNRIARYIRC